MTPMWWLFLMVYCVPGVTPAAQGPQAGGGVHFANGVKVGEVTSSSAIIWTRLTEAPERNIQGRPWPDGADAVPEGRTLVEMQDSVMGSAGEVRLQWWPEGGGGLRSSTDWAAVDPGADFTHAFYLRDQLRSATAYEMLVEGRASGSQQAQCSLPISFRTAPKVQQSAPATFTVITGQDFTRRDDLMNGHKLYGSMGELDPDFFVHTGDVIYHDKPGPLAKSQGLARYKWNRMYALPLQRAFHARVPAWFLRDDHDVLKNDCWPGQSYGDLTWEQGLAVFREQVPTGPRPYRRLRWGKDLEVWFVEGREFRSPNTLADGPDKTIWGREQKAWFLRTFAASDATFRVLISPTPILGPDRSGKRDNHANQGFRHEGDELRTFLAQQANAFILCGDRHWQYVSQVPDSDLREYSCGPTTNKHAGGFSEKNRSGMHRFLRVAGGFLSVSLEYAQDQPRLVMRHHDVAGRVVHEDAHEAR
ncbi:MAG: alkaline phosphatase D family protein [Planctomycetota bacterium]|nr:alkaline phosphatase D family protein [Planctomycetota bacterium]